MSPRRPISPVRVALALLALQVACNNPNEPGNQPALLTALPRALTSAEQQTISSANAFSFALLQTVSAGEPGKNVFISPLSASMSLGMTLNGARTATFDSMRAALQVSGQSQADINASYRSLIDLLLSLDPTVAMEIANSIWFRNTLTFNPLFIQDTRTYFDATVSGLNFSDVAATKATVNGWVSDKTHAKIEKILDEVSPDDVMYLINAVYFKGTWRSQFDPSATKTAPFTPASGSAQSAQLMTQTGTLKYAEVDGHQVVDLPYGAGAFTMTVVLPKAGTTVDQLAGGLTTAQWQTLTASLHDAEVTFSMPKLKLEYERKLNDDLTALGMGIAFTHAADFNGMMPCDCLEISYVKQKSFVNIDEEGTEAAAVTITGIRLTSAPQVVTMRVDRPYLFVIRERLSGTIVFMGKINRMPG